MKKLMRRLARAVQKLVDAVLAPYYAMKDYLRYINAVQMADEAYEHDQDRYYVMPSMDNKLLVMDRKNFRHLKRKGYIAKNATIQNAIDECFYFTPRIGSEGISEQVRKQKYSEYKNWCKAMRMLNHYTKK